MLVRQTIGHIKWTVTFINAECLTDSFFQNWIRIEPAPKNYEDIKSAFQSLKMYT